MNLSEKVTSLLITYNEEKHIRDFILNMNFVDEIIVIDSFSNDNTIAIIKEYPHVKFFQRKFDNFSSQKNFAIEKANNDILLFFDADERIPPLLKEEIITTVNKLKEEDNIAFRVYTRPFFMGREIKYSGIQNDNPVRLFRKKFCRYDGELVHENIKTDGQIRKLKHRMLHYSYKNFDHYISKINNYAWLQAEELYKKGKKVNVFHVTVKPVFRFFKHYILGLGFLDGFPGFILAIVRSYGVLSRYLKLWLLNNNLK